MLSIRYVFYHLKPVHNAVVLINTYGAVYLSGFYVPECCDVFIYIYVYI